MNDDSTTGVDDNEINQMIAGMDGATPIQPQPIAGYAPQGMPGGMPNMPSAMPQITSMHQPVSPMPVVAQSITPIMPPQSNPVPMPPEPSIAPMPEPTADTNLDDIKHGAVEELRPLVEKLDLPPDEQFDTLLLIIRSTDDSSLVPKAYAAARAIPDETRRAQALLDIIKEIDYFGHSKDI
ncbi:hypothetical protein FWF74_00015 [Candidatus Saccharibacteria bacterium]|nr:hypothetical protein [Candidatus Saccharibacteria bacterium]